LFDKIVLGGGCFLLNALMTNSKLTEVRYNTNTMKEKVIPLMKKQALSPSAISALTARKYLLRFRDALMVLMFVRGEDPQSKAARLAAFNHLDAQIGKKSLETLTEAMIFVNDEAKSFLVAHLHPKGSARKNHQRLLSELGLKLTFIKTTLTQFAQKVNQAVVDNQVDEAKKEGEIRQQSIYDL
jgi:ethanolamine utilization cobalamin adenosyltransferase